MFRPSKIAACTESTKGNKIDSNDLEYTQFLQTRKKRSSIRRKTVKNIVGNITGYVLRATSNLFSKPVKIHIDDHSSKPSSDSSINLDEIVFTTVDKKKGGKSRRKNKRTHGTKKNSR
jgi:hypothetical protein